MGVPGAFQLDWTAERVTRLKELVAEGLSAREIGNAMGVSRNAAIGKIQRLGLQLYRSPGNSERPPRVKKMKPLPKPRRPKMRPSGGAPLPPMLPPSPLALIGIPPPEAVAALRHNQCRWMVDANGAVAYCIEDRHEGASYCFGHSRLAWRTS